MEGEKEVQGRREGKDRLGGPPNSGGPQPNLPPRLGCNTFNLQFGNSSAHLGLREHLMALVFLLALTLDQESVSVSARI